MSSGTRRVGRGALLGLAAVGLLTAACGGGKSAGNASSSTTSPIRGSSTTAGPSPAAVSTSTSRAGSSTTAAAGPGATTTSAGTGTTMPAKAATIRIDSSQNGRTVALHVGDTVQISLTGCADCGYSWRMTGQPSPVVLSYEGEQTTTPSTTSTSAGQPPIAGQPVTWTWTFKAVSAHTTGFIAQYFPPGQGARPTQTFAVQLRVST